MSDQEIRVTCEDPQRIIGAINKIMPEVTRRYSRQFARQLNEIKLDYLQSYDLQGLYERTNNRTVEQIMAEYQPCDRTQTVASGEVDGVQFRLTQRRSDGESQNS